MRQQTGELIGIMGISKLGGHPFDAIEKFSLWITFTKAVVEGAIVDVDAQSTDGTIGEITVGAAVVLISGAFVLFTGFTDDVVDVLGDAFIVVVVVVVVVIVVGNANLVVTFVVVDVVVDDVIIVVVVVIGVISVDVASFVVKDVTGNTGVS